MRIAATGNTHSDVWLPRERLTSPGQHDMGQVGLGDCDGYLVFRHLEALRASILDCVPAWERRLERT